MSRHSPTKPAVGLLWIVVCGVFALFGCAGVPEVAIEEVASPDQIIGRLSLRQKIGQRFIGWIPRDGVSAEIKELLANGEIGGFIIYPWNVETIEDTRALTVTLQNRALLGAAAIPLFFAADQEGGRVAAFRFPEFVQLPSAFYLAAPGDSETVEAAAFINARQLTSLGINMNLAPVLDLYPEPDRTIIGDRSFGDDPSTVATMGKAFVKGSIRGGVIPVIKHFPGHGLSSVDSHGNLPVIDSLGSNELSRHTEPFSQAIAAGAPAVMPAHLLLPEIDPEYPVTLSSHFIDTLLRQELGFDGLIISDGLAMGALAKHYSIEETIARCFQVGIDVILVHSRYSISELIGIVVDLVDRGVLTEEKIETGTKRVMAAKLEYGILR